MRAGLEKFLQISRTLQSRSCIKQSTPECHRHTRVATSPRRNDLDVGMAKGCTLPLPPPPATAPAAHSRDHAGALGARSGLDVRIDLVGLGCAKGGGYPLSGSCLHAACWFRVQTLWHKCRKAPGIYA